MKIQFPCTDCRADAFVGYTANKQNGDWGGKLKPVERLCTKCFRKRTGLTIYGWGGAGMASRIGRR